MSRAAQFRLDTSDTARFDRDGFIGPFKVYEPEEMEERWRVIRRQLLDRSHAAYPDETAGGTSKTANYDRHLDVDLLSELVMEPRIVDRVVSILGPDVLCWRTEFFPKYAGDEGTDWHQAATFGSGAGRPQLVWPAQSDGGRFGGALTVWVAFTDSTLVNGCLQIIPGTHNVMYYDESKTMAYDGLRVNQVRKGSVKRGFYGYDYREMQIDPEWQPDESQAKSLVMRKGECVFFWSTLLHASLPHTGSKRDYRLGFPIRYVPTTVRVYPGIESLHEHGAEISLDRWAAVMVAGEDAYGHNRTTPVSHRGFKFVPRPAWVERSAVGAD